MDKFDSIQAFTQVVEAGGFAAAARKMGLSRSQVNKLVANLEDALGVRLLQRTTRKVTPTATGQAYYERCLNILAEVAAAEQSVMQLQSQAKGILRVNAPMSFGIRHLGDAIATFCQQHPHLQVEVTLNDRLIDPITEGFDLTLRISQPPASSNLVVHRIAPIQRVLCASPQYLEQQGHPQTPSQLKEQSCLHYGHLPSAQVWSFHTATDTFDIPVSGAVCSNNGEVLRSAALQHLGIALLPTFIVGEDINSGRLAPLLPDYQTSDLALYILYPLNRHLSTKVKLFTAFIHARFSA